MRSAKIVIVSENSEIPKKYRDRDGSVSIPIRVDFTKNIKERELTKLDSLVSGYTSSFIQEVSNEDMMKLNYIHYEKNKKNIRRYRAYVMDDGIRIRHLDGYLNISKVEDQPNKNRISYSFQIIGTHQIWKEEIKKIKLCEIIEDEEFVWSKDNLIELMKSNQSYREGGVSYYPLFANFGKRFTNIGTGFEDEDVLESSLVSVQDIRLVNYIKPLLVGGFCKSGYEVNSKWMSSDAFARLAGYHMGENYATKSIIEYNHLFRAKGTDGGNHNLNNFSNIDLSPRIIRIDDDSNLPCFDKGGVYTGFNAVNNFNYCFTNETNGMVRYKFHYKVKLRRSEGTGQPNIDPIKFFLDAVYGNASDQNSQHQLPIANTKGRVVTMEGDFEMNVPSGWYVQLGFFCTDINDDNAGAAGYWEEAEWYNERVSEVYIDGDLINVNKSIDPDITLYDVLIDIDKLGFLRYGTDEANKTVSIEPDRHLYDAWRYYDEALVKARGFTGSLEDAVDYTGVLDLTKVIERDISISKIPESYLFKFKDHSDKYEKYDEYTKEEPPFAKLIVNEDYNSKQLKIELKTYEPVLNDYDSSQITGNSVAPYIPFMWGKERGENGVLPEPTNKVGKRLFCVLGFVKQMRSTVGEEAMWNFEGEILSNVPTVFQKYHGYYSEFNEVGGLNPRKTKLNICFGDEEINNDIVTTYYFDSLREDSEDVKHVFRVAMTELMYNCYKSGQLMKLAFNSDMTGFYDGYYKFIELNKDSNGLTTVNVLAISNKVSCNYEIEEKDEGCDHESIMLSSLLWVDAEDINGDQTVVSDGTNIDTWVDKSNSSNNLIQIGVESVPVKATDSGKSVVEFTGDQLITQLPFLPSGGTSSLMIILVSRTRIATSGVSLGFKGEVSGDVYHNALYVPSSGNIRWEYNGFGGVEDSREEPWGSNTSDYNIWVIKHARWGATNPIQNLFRKNGVDLGSSIVNRNLLGVDEGFFVGRGSEGANWQSVNIAELLVFNRILSSEELKCVEDHLKDKWNI